MSGDHLQKYNQKRHFDRTPEPPPGDPGSSQTPPNPRFVVHKHAARRLHYDVRLEVEGTMPSWAVPKGPSYDPRVKRLAVHVEDHPLDYQYFEGVIPKGQYGGGPVIIWDAGTFRHLTHAGDTSSMREAIERGHISVWFEGEKLHGGWSLTRTRPSASGASGSADQDSWLMVKRQDEHANANLDIAVTAAASIRSGLTIEEMRSTSLPQPVPQSVPQSTSQTKYVWVAPMLAQAADEPPAGDSWIYEPKLDGLRCIAVSQGGKVQLWSRNQLSFDARFPKIVQAIKDLPVDDVVLDGELVAFDGERTSFARLQQSAPDAQAFFYVFDVLRLLGNSTVHLPLTERKALLDKLIFESQPTPTHAGLPTGNNGPVRLVQQLHGDGKDLLRQACALGWEGLVAKQADSPYRAGRSAAWRKLKCLARQELVIGGWTEPSGSRSGFGALLVGYFQGSELRYAGKVGTGFTNDTLRNLSAELRKRERATSPFADRIRQIGAHWADPELVAQIAFGEWTPEGKLRHPRFEGLRPDKPASTVTRESPPSPPSPPSPSVRST